jgi:hypothetical protein
MDEFHFTWPTTAGTDTSGQPNIGRSFCRHRKVVHMATVSRLRRSAKSPTHRNRAIDAKHRSIPIEKATLDRTVWLCEPGGFKAEIIYVAETPAAAKAFADGFNARPESECLDCDYAEAGSQVLERMVGDCDGHHSPVAARRKRPKGGM